MLNTNNANNLGQRRRQRVWLGVAGAALLVVSLAASAAPRDVAAEYVGTAHRDLYDLELTESGYGMAVGMMGTVLTTKDGGDSWKFHSYPTQRALFSVAITGDRAVITGQDGIILVRDERDAEWQTIESGTKQRLLSIDIGNQGFGVIVGTYGTLLLSNDGGQSWTLVDPKLREQIEGGYKPHLNRVQVLGNGVAVIVGEFGLVVRSKDYGKTWTIMRQGTSSLFGLDILPNGIGYAAGQVGAVLRTRDAGVTWQKLETGTDGNLLGVAVSADANTITIPGMRVMIVSDDGGNTWSEVSEGDVDSMWYMDAVATDNGVLIAGHTSKILRITKPE